MAPVASDGWLEAQGTMERYSPITLFKSVGGLVCGWLFWAGVDFEMKSTGQSRRSSSELVSLTDGLPSWGTMERYSPTTLFKSVGRLVCGWLF